MIAARNEVFPFTHDIQLLLDLLVKIREDLPAFSPPLHTYTPFGVVARYDVVATLTEEERQLHRENIAELRHFVLGRLALLP